MSETKTVKRKEKKNPVVKKGEGLTAPKKLKILVTIVDRSKADFFLDTLEGYDVNLQTVIYGKGTAPTEMLQYLGLSQLGKAVIFSVVQEDNIKRILADYEDKYFKTKNGKGIAFTIPISSVIGVMVYKFLSNSVEGARSE
ncbi:MAG: hypothetical protein K2M08_08080 [Anaeroplasmataceae bacterium]|nr:hypothetical protein [Anaeroplasmataceae bacterium]MDE6242357.1 hypothetical protein [Anaeroplasmataceae bacterium]